MKFQFAYIVGVLLVASCSSGPGVKTQDYAVLKSEKTFEYEFPIVWKGIESALAKNKISERDPEKLTPVELKKTRERTIETDWIYSRSRDKYIEYKVDDFPRKKYLQIRFKYKVVATRTIGGTHVDVEVDEQIERLDKNGMPAGYQSSSEPDSSRAQDLIEKVKIAILNPAA